MASRLAAWYLQHACMVSTRVEKGCAGSGIRQSRETLGDWRGGWPSSSRIAFGSDGLDLSYHIISTDQIKQAWQGSLGCPASLDLSLTLLCPTPDKGKAMWTERNTGKLKEDAFNLGGQLGFLPRHYPLGLARRTCLILLLAARLTTVRFRAAQCKVQRRPPETKKRKLFFNIFFGRQRRPSKENLLQHTRKKAESFGCHQDTRKVNLCMAIMTTQQRTII